MNESNHKCDCGCGRFTQIAKTTRRGVKAGEPNRRLQGHRRIAKEVIANPDRYTVSECGYETPCWIWDGRVDKDGYPMIGEGERAHRRAYEQQVGPIPEGRIVHHLCEQKSCVRGDHLEAVTPTEHERAHSKLTPDMVRAIRASDRTQEELAAEYGTTRSNIGYIKRHVTWNDLDS